MTLGNELYKLYNWAGFYHKEKCAGLFQQLYCKLVNVKLDSFFYYQYFLSYMFSFIFIHVTVYLHVLLLKTFPSGDNIMYTNCIRKSMLSS